jgi:hypothetical protein
MYAELRGNKGPSLNDGAGQPPADAVCIENIGPRERALRARFGTQALILGVVLAVILVLLRADRWWRLVLFFPLAVAVTNWLQARERT